LVQAVLFATCLGRGQRVYGVEAAVVVPVRPTRAEQALVK